jgi:hypothetical protein
MAGLALPAVPEGYYYVRVLLAEMECTSLAACTRSLDIRAEGMTVQQGVSIARQSGLRTAAVHAFVVLVTDGRLDLEISGSTGSAVCNGIIAELATVREGRTLPLEDSSNGSPGGPAGHQLMFPPVSQSKLHHRRTIRPIHNMQPASLLTNRRCRALTYDLCNLRVGSTSCSLHLHD